jgi:mono/diheme cytochrome c family protein
VAKILALGALLTLVLGIRFSTRAPDPRPIRAEPIAPAVSAEARGRAAYLHYGCAMCHGAEGEGGFSNPNAETDGKVPGVLYVAEGYTRAELRRLLLHGTPRIGKADPEGEQPPYRMPGGDGHMTGPEVDDLVAYLFSLYPESAGDSWR